MIRSSILGALLTGMLGSSCLFAAAQVHAAAPVPALTTVAVVDLQRCFLETAQGAAAQKKLRATAEKTEARLKKKSDALRKSVADLRAKAAMLAPKELEKRQTELMRKDAELQQLFAESSRTLSAKEAELTESIYKRVQSVVSTIAKANKVQAVLVRSQMSVLYTKPAFDLTNKVILAYDKKFPKKK